MVQYYNCSCLDFPTYHEGAEPPETYCKELFNEKLVPYGFHPISLPGGYTKGFPVFFDINLSQDRAQQFYLYVEEGHYIAESETQDLKAHLVTYNAELLTFANIKITFDFMKVISCSSTWGVCVLPCDDLTHEIPSAGVGDANVARPGACHLQ